MAERPKPKQLPETIKLASKPVLKILTLPNTVGNRRQLPPLR